MKKFVGGMLIGAALGYLAHPYMGNTKDLKRQYKRMKRTACRTFRDLRSHLME